jgi:hypothetical protein
MNEALIDKAGVNCDPVDEIARCLERIDLPHLRNGGSWKAKCQNAWPCCCPRCQLERYLWRLHDLGVSVSDAWDLIEDLYWDCFEELIASGRPIEENWKWDGKPWFRERKKD